MALLGSVVSVWKSDVWLRVGSGFWNRRERENESASADKNTGKCRKKKKLDVGSVATIIYTANEICQKSDTQLPFPKKMQIKKIK